jgi:hypothetical protein
MNYPLVRNVAHSVGDRKISNAQIDINSDGIAWIGVGFGEIDQFAMLDGTRAWRTEAPSAEKYVVPLLIPVAGFIIPRGLIRLLTWIGTGFYSSNP